MELPCDTVSYEFQRTRYPMTTADEKVDAFISNLEHEFKDIPEVVIKEGAQSVLDFINDKKTLAEMFNITPDMLRYAVEQGYNQFKTGRYDDAARIFKVLTFLDWNNAYFHSVHGSILQKQKKYGEAVAEYTEAIKLNPKDIVSLVSRAEVFLIHGHIPYAQYDLDEAIKCTDIGEPKWVERARQMKKRIVTALTPPTKSTKGEPNTKGKKGAK